VAERQVVDCDTRKSTHPERPPFPGPPRERYCAPLSQYCPPSYVSFKGQTRCACRGDPGHRRSGASIKV